MQITFGMNMDGRSPVGADSRLGEVVTGPAGLLDILETRLGLKGIRRPVPLRIVQYQRCLGQADDGERFYSRSFDVDPLGVARELLGWRDEWMLAGWDGTAAASDSRRLRDLAEVERHARDILAAGFGDRLQAVRRTLQSRDPGIEAIRLVDPLDDLAPVWRVLLAKLPVVEQPGAAAQQSTAPEGTDLAALQRALISNQAVAFKGDGTCFAVRADSEQTLARAIAGAVAGGGDWSAERLVVVAGRHGRVLDQALASADLPQAGLSDRSPSRPAPQLLRLALSLLWEPLDPYRLLEFLTHPVCPLNGDLRARLARAVADAPGAGGPKWQRAVEDARAKAVERADGNPDAAEDIDKQLSDWLQVERYGHDSAPLPVLAERCSQVLRWAATRAATLDDDDPRRAGFRAAQSEAASAAAALDELLKGGGTSLTRLQLDRLIDQVSLAGSTRPDALAQCGHVLTMTHPGAVIEAVRRVVWWDFSAPALARRWPWSVQEIEQLRAHGVRLPAADDRLQTEARSWLRPVLAAREHLVLVMPGRRGAEAVVPHPLWDQVVALDERSTLPILDVDQFVKDEAAHPWLNVAPQAVPHRPLPRIKRWWQLPDHRRLPGRDVESYSSLSNFVNAPHRWVLYYLARLKPGSVSAVTSGNTQKGELLHRWFEWLFTSPDFDWRGADRAAVEAWTDKHFGELLAQAGANFLLPGHLREREELRATAVESAMDILKHLRGAGVEKVEVEYEAEERVGRGRITGQIDMLVADADGREAVVDVKWSGLKYRIAELRANRHLQLATYAMMRETATGTLPPQAYFVLALPRLVAQSNDYFSGAAVFEPDEEGANTRTLWVAFGQAWSWRREQLDGGRIEIVTESTAADEDSVPPDGAYAIDKPKDGFDDYLRLVGWKEGA